MTFSVKQMDPVMRSALLGRAYSPSRASMKFLLHMKAGDSDSARELAGKCGPMSKAFGALADAAADDSQVE